MFHLKLEARLQIIWDDSMIYRHELSLSPYLCGAYIRFADRLILRFCPCMHVRQICRPHAADNWLIRQMSRRWVHAPCTWRCILVHGKNLSEAASIGRMRGGGSAGYTQRWSMTHATRIRSRIYDPQYNHGGILLCTHQQSYTLWLYNIWGVMSHILCANMRICAVIYFHVHIAQFIYNFIHQLWYKEKK